MVVNERLAREAWPGQDPIGRRIACCEGGPDDPAWKEVVGVVADVRSRGPAQEVQAEFYLPMDQVPVEAWGWISRSMTLVLRARGVAPASLAGALRAAVREVDPTVPLYDVATMPERMHRQLATARFGTLLLGSLGALGLALASVGIYGVLAYFVSQRTREIGLRMALGAGAREVVALVVLQGLATVGIGLALGLAATLAAGRALEGLLFGVGRGDPVTLAAVAALLVTVALAASLLPAQRAARLDPARVLAEP